MKKKTFDSTKYVHESKMLLVKDNLYKEKYIKTNLLEKQLLF